MALRIDTGIDTVGVSSMLVRLAKLGLLGPSSELYKTVPSVKDSIDVLIADGILLSNAETQVAKDEAQAAKSRGVRDGLLLTVDGSYGVCVANLEKHAVTGSDITSNGFVELTRTHYPMAAPLDLLLAIDHAKNLLDIHVKHADGMRSAHVEYSPDPIGPNTYTRLDGIAAVYHLPMFAPGTWWVRARSVRGTQVSNWLGPKSIVIK